MKSALPPATLPASLAQWRKTVESELKGVPFEKKLVTRIAEGTALQPLYTRLDLAGLADLTQPPGVAPFLRGTRPNSVTNRTWEICQEIPAATPAEFNQSALAALMQGQNGVSVTPDLATLDVRDPDTSPAGSVGVNGLSLADTTDVLQALDKIAIDCVPVHLYPGATAQPLAALYLAAATQRKISLQQLTGSIAADPLGEWVRRGRTATSIEEQIDALAEWTSWASSHTPALRTIGVSTEVWSDAGATATQELAFALAAGVEVLRSLARRDVAVATSATRMRFTFSVGSQFFAEIAKFRAFRLLWARALSAFGSGASAKEVIVHARTGRWNKTLRDAHVNMLRVTTEACSAVLGGVDSLHIAPFDEVGGAPDEIAQRIARNVHTLLSEEFHFTDTMDPAGGSWYIEKLTDDFARRAWTLFQEIEAQGGYMAALRMGFPQKCVATAAAEKDEAISKRRMSLIGTNLFPNLKEKPLVIKTRDAVALAATRGLAIKARRKTGVIIPAGIDGAIQAASAGATLGQLAEAMGATASATASASDEITPVKARRAAEGFEALRSDAEALLKRTGTRPKVFIAKIGPVKQHKPRADFTAGFFTVGGFDLAGKESFDSAEAAAHAAVKSGAPIVVLCSTDETYPDLVPVFGKALKAGNPNLVFVLAGLPAEPATVAAFRTAGVDEFIHARANVRELLAKFINQIGAIK